MSCKQLLMATNLLGLIPMRVNIIGTFVEPIGSKAQRIRRCNHLQAARMCILKLWRLHA